MIMEENNFHSVESIPYSIRNAIKRTADKNEKFSGTKYKKLNERIHDWFNHNLWITPKALFYLIKNNLTELPFCEYCKKTQLTPKQYELSYKNKHFFCCAEHASKSEIIREKINKTWELNGGVPFKRKDVIDKRRNTWQEKYGGNNPISDPAILEKFKNTCIERYGVDNPSKSKMIQNKVRNTLIEHYGVDTPIKNPEIEEKRRNTWLEKYGVDHPCKTEEVRERQKQTWMDHYGIDHMSKVPEVGAKIKLTQRLGLWDSKLEKAAECELEILSSKDDYIEGHTFKYRCLKCGNVFESPFPPNKNRGPRCLICYPKHTFVSKKETEVANWIRNIYNGEIQQSVKSIIYPYELDIYIPAKNIAIEFNGLYWHSDIYKNHNYHQNKSMLCKEKGIRLIHILESDWDTKEKIVKDIISSALGIFKKRIYARKCNVNSLSYKEYKAFLDENHIQGSIISKHRYGLYYNNELVAVLGYGNSRFEKNTLELHRYCSKKGYQIIGGFSKLLKHSKFQGISYIDLSYFDGKGYFKNNFKFIKYTTPNYIWCNFNTGAILKRYQTFKNKLYEILGNDYDTDLSENKNMELNGWFKIFDAGNIKVELYK